MKMNALHMLKSAGMIGGMPSESRSCERHFSSNLMIPPILDRWNFFVTIGRDSLTRQNGLKSTYFHTSILSKALLESL